MMDKIKWSFFIFLISSFSANAQQSALKDTLAEYQAEKAMKSASVSLQKHNDPFDYELDDAESILEFRKLQNFESRQDSAKAISNLEDYLLESRTYIKDSLQILLVKLVAIKKLDDKQLLTKDIVDHGSYYIDLLLDFKDSELDPKTYIFLERKVSQIHQQKLAENYTKSLWANGIGLICILVLVFLVIHYRRRELKVHVVPLSKQENTIKTLILEGKTNKEIANELFISLSTVKTHISNIYSKLNISSRKELQF